MVFFHQEQQRFRIETKYFIIMSVTHHVIIQPDLLNNSQFSIRRLGIAERMEPKVIFRPFGNTDYLFMHFHSETVIETAHERSMFLPGTFMIWEPGQSHYYGNAGKEWDHSWVHLYGTAVSELLSSCRIPLNAPFIMQPSHIFTRFLQAVYSETIEFSVPDIQILQSHFMIFMRELARSLSAKDFAKVPERFLAVKQYLDTDFTKPISLGELAARAYLSIPHFCAKFRKYFNVSCIEYLIRLRLQYASFLLRDVNMSIKQVAHACGYEDLYYFSKLFKKKYGASPKNYREKFKI